RVFVMDISGVVTVDTAVANNFIRITQATRLMGCDCIISGISPSVARTLVELGANVGEARTTATLRHALQLALPTISPTVRNGKASGRVQAEVMHRWTISRLSGVLTWQRGVLSSPVSAKLWSSPSRVRRI